jgi:phospholipid/cholesterol/gamma-HCH transport system ATP-binding protein
VIEIRGLKKRLGDKQVLDGVDIDIATGETLVVLGPSGTGKSVLLKHIVGLMDADAGSIQVDGEEIVGRRESELNVVRRRFGMLFQGAALFDSMTVGENVAFALRQHRASIGEDEVRQRVPELSGGMQKRVALARAIIAKPDLIFFDEPTTGLDPITADVIDLLIKSLQERLGVTSVIVTHDLASAFKVANRMAMLYGGKVVFSGRAEELRTTDNPYVRQFMDGSSQGPIQPV